MASVKYDAIVVGAGPNGLSAAITLARAGLRVLVREARPVVGGAARTEELTLPGFRHDTFSASHPLAAASPFFRSLELEKHGLRWIRSPAVIAHPLDDGAVLMESSVDATAESLGVDAAAYRALMGPLARGWESLLEDALAPMLRLPRHPFSFARFGLEALRSAEGLARARFRGERARALFGGIAAHSGLALSAPGSAAMGLVLGLAGHAVGWPIPEGGAQAISDALARCLTSLGGEIETSAPVESLEELPSSRVVMLDLTPRQLLRLAGARLPSGYRGRLERFRYGTASFKLDWALASPIPWRDPSCLRAAVVHLGGTLEELARSEARPARGEAPERPYVLLCQPSLFDPSRAPAGRHTAWAYCHVPHAWKGDAAQAIESAIERFAPGFGERVLARHVLTPAALEARNGNLVGGDISGGHVSLAQLVARPVLSASPYSFPLPGVFICSSSTPPGPGVHGMCGYQAARAALASLRPLT